MNSELLGAYEKKAWARMQAIINATPIITASSGLTLMPLVSSSKNLSSPALWAGMGDLLSRFFSLLLLMSSSAFNLLFWGRIN